MTRHGRSLDSKSDVALRLRSPFNRSLRLWARGAAGFPECSFLNRPDLDSGEDYRDVTGVVLGELVPDLRHPLVDRGLIFPDACRRLLVYELAGFKAGACSAETERFSLSLGDCLSSRRWFPPHTDGHDENDQDDCEHDAADADGQISEVADDHRQQ